MKKLMALSALLLLSFSASAHLHMVGCTYNPNTCSTYEHLDLFMQAHVLANGPPAPGTVLQMQMEQDLPDSETCCNLLYTWTKRYVGGTTFEDVSGTIPIEYVGLLQDYHTYLCFKGSGGGMD